MIQSNGDINARAKRQSLARRPVLRSSSSRLVEPTKDTRQLNWLLAWAVVFCDIGTSVYYVPGILYGHVKDATPFFVLLTTGGFILLSLKYIEISWRNPEGGGVVTITTKAFGPMWGCLGGMLITVDYFLTTAISSVSGFHYIGSAFPALDATSFCFPAPVSVVLAALNVIGIRESAAVALVMACASFVVNMLVIGMAAILNMNVHRSGIRFSAGLAPDNEISFYRSFGRLRLGVARFFRIGKHQPAESGNAFSAPQDHPASDGCGDRSPWSLPRRYLTALSIGHLAPTFQSH